MTARQEYLKLAKTLSLVSPSNAIYWFDGQLQKAQERIAELEKDKARWDYLNSHLIDFATAPEGRFYVRGLPQAFSTLREAIDAAMKGEQ